MVRAGGWQVAAAAVFLAAGCEDQRRHQASQDLKLLDVEPRIAADAAPEVTARALLSALRELQLVRAEGLGVEDNRDRYNRALGEIVSLMDQRRVHAMMREPGLRSPLIPKNIERAPALKLVAESWASMVAHYVDGISPALPLSASSVMRGGVKPQPDGTKVQSPDEVRVMAVLVSPREKAIIDEIAADKSFTDRRDEWGRPIAYGSPQWREFVEPRALERGVHVPIETTLTISLARVDGAWRVYSLALGPGRPVVAAAPSNEPPLQGPRPAPATTQPS